MIRQLFLVYNCKTALQCLYIVINSDKELKSIEKLM